MIRIEITQRHVIVAGFVRSLHEQSRTLLDWHGTVSHAIVDEQWHGQRRAVLSGIEICVFQADGFEAQTGESWNDPLDGIRCAHGGQIAGGGERHLLPARYHRGRGENRECDVLMFLGEHGGDPCAFRLRIQSGFRRIDARPLPERLQ